MLFNTKPADRQFLTSIKTEPYNTAGASGEARISEPVADLADALFATDDELRAARGLAKQYRKSLENWVEQVRDSERRLKHAYGACGCLALLAFLAIVSVLVRR